MTIDTNELRRLAQAAMHPVTKGRWMRLFGERTVYDRMEDGCRGIPVVSTPFSPPHPFEAACLDFIAAANPTAISELLDRLKAAEKERDDVAQQLVQSERGKRAINEECDALRAKIAAMEQQVPICRAEDLKHAELLLPTLGLKPENPLYAIPGAQEQEPTRDWWDCLIADISAIDCMYRGSPTYAHDAYWMRDHVVWMLKKRRGALPGAKGEGK